MGRFHHALRLRGPTVSAFRGWNRTEPSQPPRLHLAASPGGHLDLLMSLRPFAGWRCTWITATGKRAEALKGAGLEVYLLPEYGRSPRRLLAHVARASLLVIRDRPRFVVTSGAGVVVPFCLLAWLFGAKLVFVETMARVTSPSASGRVLSRVACRVLVQWPEMTRVYRGATLCRPALLEGGALRVAQSGSGTFVAVGTHGQPFDRVLRMVDRAVAAGLLPDPVEAQSGICSYRPRNYTTRRWMSADEIKYAVDNAEYVVCHAGSGIVSAALRSGKRPLVLARRAHFGEHVDDHQEQIVRKLGELGVAVALDGDEISEEQVQAARGQLPALSRTMLAPSVQEIVEGELRAFGAPALNGAGTESA
jgi:UDP-N-acetylglucosamine--N-acetylmuramyl-(pentapeptide) pyrophosphoryl-undecaprenol N-acetylglucosamine transferase